jgi:hypothetical protein
LTVDPSWSTFLTIPSSTILAPSSGSNTVDKCFSKKISIEIIVAPVFNEEIILGLSKNEG